MKSIDGSVLDFGRLDLLATEDTAIHRLDARAKVLVVLVFIISVVSYNKYELAALFPYFLFPAIMVALANLPASFIARKVALALPFALAVGIFNPLFDREVLVQFGSLGISAGWISCASIVVRAILTVSAALILVSVTGFPTICQALERLGMPQLFAMQLLFLYRYISVLMEEGARVSRARELRSFGSKGKGIHSYGSLVGHLLLRTWERAERIHLAMLARGFKGEFHTQKKTRFGKYDFFFLFGWSTLFIALRYQNLSHVLGEFVAKIALTF